MAENDDIGTSPAVADGFGGPMPQATEAQVSKAPPSEAHGFGAPPPPTWAPVTITSLLRATAQTVGANAALFFTVAALCSLPFQAIGVMFEEGQAWLVGSAAAGTTSVSDLASLWLPVLLGTFFLICLGMVTHASASGLLAIRTLAHIQGKPLAPGEAVQRTLRALPRLLALALLVGLATGLGTLACVVPGVILTCVLFASTPVTVAENAGPINAMKRSADLTNGHRVTIFAGLLLLGAVNMAFTLGWGMLGAVGTVMNDGGPAPVAIRIVTYVGSWVIGAFVVTVSATLSAVFYAQVRGLHDNVDSEALAEVFG